MSSRRIASHANLIPVQEKTVEPFSTFNSDKVNKLTRIISNGDDGVTHGLEIKNCNDHIDSIRDITIFSSGNYFDPQIWAYDSEHCTVVKTTGTDYFQSFKIHSITEPCVQTIEYSLKPSRCKFDFDNFIGKNVKIRFNFEFKLNCGSPKKIIASVNNDSYSVDYPRYRTDTIKLTVVHNLIDDEFNKNGTPKPLNLKLSFVLDPEDNNSCYRNDMDQACCNGQSEICISELKYTCEILSHEEKIFDYSVIDGSTLYNYPTTYVHPTHKLYVTPGVAIKDDIVLDEKGLDVSKNTPTMVLDLNDPNSWIKSNPYVTTDFYLDGASQIGYVLNKNDNVLKLNGSVNTETNNLEFDYNGIKLQPIDDFETHVLDRTLQYTYNDIADSKKIIVEFPQSVIAHLDNKDLYGTRAYAISKHTGKIVKIFDLDYDKANYKYTQQYVEFAYDDLVFNTNEALEDQIEFKLSVGPIKVSGNYSEINTNMVKWANVVVYYTYFKHPEPNMSYIGLVRDEDLKDDLHKEDYLVLGRVRFISPNTVDLITYSNRQEFTWWSDKAQNIEYGDQIPLEIQKLWINPYGKLDIPNSVSDALSKLIKWIPEYFNVIRLHNKTHKNVVDMDSDTSTYVYDGKDVLAIEKENFNAERDAGIDRAKIKLTKIGAVTKSTVTENDITEVVTTFHDMPSKLMAYRKEGDMDYGLLPFLRNSNNYSHPQYMSLNTNGVYSVASNKTIHIKVLNGHTKSSNNIQPDHIYVNGVEVPFTYISSKDWITFDTDCGGYYTVKIVKEGYLDYEVNTCTYCLDYSNVTLFTEIEGFNSVLSWGLTPYDLDTHLYMTDMCNDVIEHAFYENKGGMDNNSTVHVITDTATIDINTDDRTSYGPEITKVIPSVTDYLNQKKYICIVDNFNMRTGDQTLSFNNICQNYINQNESWPRNVCELTDNHLKSIISGLYTNFDEYLADRNVNWNCLTRQQKEDFVYEVYNGHECIGRKSANRRAKVVIYFNNKVYEVVAPNNVEGKYWHVYQIVNGNLYIINEIKNNDVFVGTLNYNSDPTKETYDYASDKLARGLTILPEDNVDWVLLKNVLGDKGVSKHNYSLGYYDEDNYYVECYYSNSTTVPFTFFDKQNQKVVKVFDVDYTLQRNELDCSYNAKYGALLHSDDSTYSETVAESDKGQFVLPFIRNSNPKSNDNDNVLKKAKIREGQSQTVDLTADRLIQLLDRIHYGLYTPEHPHKSGTIPVWVSGKYGAGYLQTAVIPRGTGETDLTCEYLSGLLSRIHDDTTTQFTHTDGGLVCWTSSGNDKGFQTTSKYNFDSTVSSKDWVLLPSWNDDYTKIIKSKYKMNVQSDDIQSNTIMSVARLDGDWCLTNTIYTVDQNTTTVTNSSATSIANTSQIQYLQNTKMNKVSGEQGQIVTLVGDADKTVVADWIYDEDLLIVQSNSDLTLVMSQSDVKGILINTQTGTVYTHNGSEWVAESLTMGSYLPRGRFAYNKVTNKFFYVDSNRNVVYLTKFLSLDGKNYNFNSSVENNSGKLATWDADKQVLNASEYSIEDVFEEIKDRHLMVGQLKFIARKNLKKYGEYDDDFNGWVYPDGRALSKTNFSEAFDVWGYTYGGSGELFNIPDLTQVVQINQGTNGLVTSDGTQMITNKIQNTVGAFEYDSNTNTWNLAVTANQSTSEDVTRSRIPTLIYIGRRKFNDSSTYWTVNFLDHDGNVIDTQVVKSGMAAVPPVNVSRPGYTFTGWDNNNYIRVTQNLDIKAQYTRNTYKVQFVDTVTDQVIATQDVLGCDNAVMVTHPIHAGYEIPENDDDKYEGDYTNVISDRTIKLLYTRQYFDVVFKLEDDTIYKVYNNVPGGSALSAPTAPVNEGFTFKNWSNTNKLSCVSEDVTCVASYEITKCKVTFVDSVTSTILQVQRDIPYGSTVIPPTPLEHEGTSFSTWSIDLTSVRGDCTAIAYYIYDAIIVKFCDGLTGDQIGEDMICQPGTLDITQIPTASKVGYNFTGWQSDRINCYVTAGTNGVCTDAYANHSVTFTAQYSMIRLNVEFVDHYGNVIEQKVIDYGQPCTTPDVPALDGYQFLDWVGSDNVSTLESITTDCSFTATYDTPDVDVVNVTYHMNYTPEYNTITYNDNI